MPVRRQRRREVIGRWVWVGRLGLGLAGLDVDELAALALAELHLAGGEGEEGVVAAASDVLTGVEAGAALAHDDRAGLDGGAVEHLHAEALRCGVTAVPGGPAALGLRHL